MTILSMLANKICETGYNLQSYNKLNAKPKDQT